MTGDGRERCGFSGDGEPCGRPAEWAILVGLDEEVLACDEHRNATLLRFEAKDVSGIHPLRGGEDEPSETSSGRGG